MVSKTRSSSHENSNTPAIVGGIIGGGGGVICVIGIVAFVQRRRRRDGSILSNSTKNGLQAIVTPFNPIFSEAALESGTSMEPLVSGDPEAEMVGFHGLSFLPPKRARAPPAAHIPAGVSSKEIARIRAELRRDALISQQSHNSLSSDSQSTSSESPVVPTGETPSSYDTRRLHSEVESLRREMERLRTEAFVLEAPPSYVTEGDR